MPEVHNCKYDYKPEWKKQLEKNNPIVLGEKITTL
jgi:hypothetical protein